MKLPRSLPLPKAMGDSASIYEFSDQESLETNLYIHKIVRHWMGCDFPWLVEIVPGYTTALIIYNPLQIDFLTVDLYLEESLQHLSENELLNVRDVEIPVKYGGEEGPDLEDVARHCRMSSRDVIKIHSAGQYQVYMMGFTPGFPYLGGMDPRIATPRLTTPRINVPAGSVGIAGIQTGIYPLASPGGWRIIGRTEIVLFDPSRKDPFLFAPGDRIRFIEV